MLTLLDRLLAAPPGEVARIVVFNALLLSTGVYAFWRGGAPERVTAMLFLFSAVASVLNFALSGEQFHQPAYIVIALDLVLLAALVIVALYANRSWPMTMAAMQLILVGIHVVRISNSGIFGWVYAVMLGLWSYPMLGLLAVGTWRHRRRLRANGADRPWSGSLPQWRWAIRGRSRSD